MTPNEEEIRGAIAQQAGEWFIAHQAGPLAAGDNAAFLAWLRASPIHVQEYLGVARVARGLGAAVGGPEVPLETFLEQVRPGEDRVVSLGTRAPTWRPPASRLSLRRAWPIAASLLALAAGALWWAHDGQMLGLPKTYQTAHGEQMVRWLPDGTVLRLDTDSAVTVRYSSRERVVEVNRGRSLFEVPHNDSRRFRVAAGVTGAIAVGTQFDVYRKAGVTLVTVAEGQVAVFTGEPVWLQGEGTAPAYVQRVKAGYQLRVDVGVLSAQPVPVDLNQALGWLQHKIVFEHRPLGEVAAEFNRYGRIPIEIEDETLRSLPVSGTFDADDTDSFVAFLERLPGVRVERTPARIRVVKVTPTT
jgi:transmembrane sensor